MKTVPFDENLHPTDRRVTVRGLSARERPAADKVLRTVRNLHRVGLTPAEIGWMFDLPADLVGPVVE